MKAENQTMSQKKVLTMIQTQAALLAALSLTVPLALAGVPSDSKLDCEVVKQEVSADATAPSLEGLKNAAQLYAVSPSVASCVYPAVSVRSLPVGEYEAVGDTSPDAITLTGRVEYSWGPYKYQQAVLSVPSGLSVSTHKLQSGQLVIEAATSDIHP